MGYSLSIDSSQVSGPGANQSTVTATLTMTASNVGYDGYGTSWGMSIGGHAFSDGGPSALNTDGSGSESWSHSESYTFDHDAAGYRGEVSCYASFNGSGGWSPPYMEAGPSKQAAVNYTIIPATPTFASISRSVRSISINVNAVATTAGANTYYVDYSQNGGGWTGQQSSTGTSFTFSNLANGSSYVFRTYASNSDGTSSTSSSGSYYIPTIPSAPGTISVSTPSGLSCTVTTSAASSGGATITAYYIQASADNGATWQSAIQLGGWSYTYSALTPGATYKFRTYAVNEMGSGPYATTASTFVPAGGKRWTGSAWQATSTAKRWNGTAWVDLTTAKRWNGSAWINLQ